MAELRGRGARLIGVDVVPLSPPPGVEALQANLAHVPLPDSCADLVFSRSVMEHVSDPDAVYAEAWRLLKPGGRWIFLTANRWDYTSLISRAIPNRLHGRIVATMEGREEKDVFPTAYRTNDRAQITAHARRVGFKVDRFERLIQYPSMFGWNGAIYFAASLYELAIERSRLLAPLRGWLFVELVKPPGAPSHASALIPAMNRAAAA